MTNQHVITISEEAPLGVQFEARAFAADVLRTRQVPEAQIDITFVDNPTLRDLNKTHLNHDYDTDIITFNLSDETGPLVGDIYISVDKARENAEAYDTTYENEIRFLIVHGILHLLDYEDYTDEDRAQMFAEQNRILALLTT